MSDGGANGGQARWVVSLALLVVLLGVGAWLLSRPAGGPGLTASTPGPSPPEALPSPGSLPATSPAASGAATPTHTAPAPSPGTTVQVDDGDGPRAPAGGHGAVRMRLRLPPGIEAGAIRVAQLRLVAPDGRLGVARPLALGEAVEGDVRAAESGRLPAGAIAFVVELPGVASGGPFEASVPTDAVGDLGELSLSGLGALALTFDPAPTGARPVFVVCEDTASPDTASRRRHVLCTGVQTVLANLPPGRYRCTARAAGRAVTVREDLAVEASREQAVTIPMAPEARCTVRVLDPSGGVPPRLFVELRPADGPPIRQRCESQNRAALSPITILGGRATLGELPAGRLTLAVATTLGGPFVALGDVQLEAGDNAPAAFTWRE